VIKIKKKEGGKGRKIWKRGKNGRKKNKQNKTKPNKVTILEWIS
jgi:hypothetical protein